MSVVFIALVSTLVISVLVQLFLVAGFVNRLRRWQQPLLEDQMCPPAAVILCLRGGDPFLSKCIAGLLTQDYPNYEVRFMVDSESDPAMPILKSTIAEHSFARYKIETLASPRLTCSLKCSSLVQAINGLDDSTLFLAQLDADTIPQRSWLRELATALAPADVGAATGNRWYMPERCSQGAMIRYVWNAAAVVQMYWYSIAWGGTLAIKLDSIKRAGLIDRWSRSLCEDTMLRQQLGSIGERIAFVPSLMMVNREDCTVGSFLPWVTRQLLTAKLYHPFWLAVAGHGISSALVLVWGWGFCLASLIEGDFATAGQVGLAMVIFQTCLTLMIPWIESAVSKMLRSRGEETSWQRDLSWPQFFWFVCATQWVYTWALLSCLFLRSVDWRGIRYDVAGSWEIKMLGYRPFANEDQPHEVTQRSL